MSRSGDPSSSCLLGPGLCTAQQGRGNALGLRSGGPGLRFWPQKTPTLPFPLRDLGFLSQKDKCVAGRRGKALDPFSLAWQGERGRGQPGEEAPRPHGGVHRASSRETPWTPRPLPLSAPEWTEAHRLFAAIKATCSREPINTPGTWPKRYQIWWTL